MNTPAAWWDPAVGGGLGSAVIRHAPDDGSYHLPDERQSERMRHGRGQTVLIPRANDDGTSSGFNGTVAGIVHVDPEAPDGGTVVDLRSLTGQIMNQAIQMSQFPHEVFYKLGQPPDVVKVRPRQLEPPRQNSLIPAGGYVVPKASDDGRQLPSGPAMYSDGPREGSSDLTYQTQEESVLNPVPPLPPLLQQPITMPGQFFPLPQQVPTPMPQQPAIYQAPAPYQPPVPVYVQDPNLQNALGQLVQGMGVLTQRLQNLESRPAVMPLPTRAAPLSPATLPVMSGGRSYKAANRSPENIADFEENVQPIPRLRERRLNSIDQYASPDEPQHLRDLDSDPRDGIIVGFESLRLPFVTGPIGLKAKQQVFFEFPQTGKQSAWYHLVTEEELCVVLTYDTRFEGGTQFMPPDLGDVHFKLHVPGLKKTFEVSSLGFFFPLGALDVVVLYKHEIENLDYGGK